MQGLNIQCLFSVTIKNWEWLCKKHHISLFLVSDHEGADPLFCSFFVNSFGTRRLIRKLL